MVKKPTSKVNLDFAFFNILWTFYDANRGQICKQYRELSKKFLDYNHPANRRDAFLRRPQFEALEIYIFLKEFLDNAKVETIFEDWYRGQNKFKDRKIANVASDDALQGSLGLDQQELDNTVVNYDAIVKAMKSNSRSYPNYIFALTMGTGKTLLMATCIFYEFLLANKWPKDKKYCHNALIFAPDKTVLQSLREIETFDISKVVPKEYVGIFDANLKFHFLDEAGTSLSTMDGSKFNLIVSNTQKIILKRTHAEKTAAQQLFENDKPDYGEFSDLYGDLGLPVNEDDLQTNQRFEKLSRLPQLGVFVDEAHHSFGQALKKDMMGGGSSKVDNSLRTTIDELAKNLEAAGTHVVACFNYTGTPYVGKDVLPEVVYAFNLKDAIQELYLKSPEVNAYTTTRTEEFVKIAVKDFLEATKGLRPEGMLPKLAFFATSVEELTEELKPELERQLANHGISTDKILVNVGDDKITKSDDIREFNNLDTPESTKQFILLVNKGREGWNCRSLFGVAMYRSPKSKVFVLQATMRCLRSVGNKQYTGSIYLSKDNYDILDAELQANFRMTASEFSKPKIEDKKTLQVRVREEVTIKLLHVKQNIKLKEKQFIKGTALDLDPTNEEAWHELTKEYKILQTTTTNLQAKDFNQEQFSHTKDRTSEKDKVEYTSLTLVAEISRYLNLSPIKIEKMLDQTKEGLSNILYCINEFNELLYKVVIPKLFNALYDQEVETETVEKEVQLIIPPAVGGLSFYEIAEGKGGTSTYVNTQETLRDKSFNLDTYTFDSNPEYSLFWDLIKDDEVEKIYFTGMFTDKTKTEFYFQYIDPDSYALRNYYPDFLVKLKNGQYIIVEVKGDHQFEDPTVLAKAKAAKEYASKSQIEYRMIKGTDATAHLYHHLLNGGVVQQPAGNLYS